MIPPGILKLPANIDNPLLFECLTAVVGQIAVDDSHMVPASEPLSQERNSLTTEWLFDWFRVTVAWRDGQSRRERLTARTAKIDGGTWWRKGERDHISGCRRCFWSLQRNHLSPVGLTSLCRASHCCSCSLLFIVLYKLELIQHLMDLPGYTYPAHEDSGLHSLLSFPSLKLKLREWVNRDRGTAVFTAAFPCANLPIQRRR